MATLRKRKGKWTVEIRRKGHQNVYGTFYINLMHGASFTKLKVRSLKTNTKIFSVKKVMDLRYITRNQ